MPFLRSQRQINTLAKQAGRKSHKNGFLHTVYYAPAVKSQGKYLPESGFKGEWKSCRFNGHGRLLYSKFEELHEGKFLSNLPHGYGKWAKRTKDGKNYYLKYRGFWEDGKPHGEGNLILDDNSIYIGTMRNGKQNKWGEHWAANGTYYYGEWKDEAREGLGIMVYENGDRYEGLWVNGEKHGRGSFYFLQKGVVQEGVWIKGICIFSTMKTIPFRQTGTDPIPFRHPPLELVDSKQEIFKDHAARCRANNISIHMV